MKYQIQNGFNLILQNTVVY